MGGWTAEGKDKLRWDGVIAVGRAEISHGLFNNVDVNGTTTSIIFNATDEDNALQIDGTTILRTGTSANFNIFLGEDTFANDERNSNVGIGYRAGYNISGAGGTGTENVFIGAKAGYGDASANTASYSVAIGGEALFSNHWGYHNMAIGGAALRENYDGHSNVAIGRFALWFNTDGDGNVGIGTSANSGNETGDFNVAIGYQALRGGSYQNHSENVAIGWQSGNSMTTGSSNILLGHRSGYRQTTNSNRLIIDNRRRTTAALELSQSIIYGIMTATPASQTLRINADLGIGITPTLPLDVKAKSGMSALGGICVKLTNKTGANSIAGYCVTNSDTTADAVRLVPIDEPNCIGVFLESGVSDGSEAWIVVSGIADVYFWATTTLGHMARTGLTADTGEVAGQAISEASPTSPFSVDKHFCEVGHVLEAREGAGLARCVLHNN